MALHETLPPDAESHSTSGEREPRESFGNYLLFKLLKRDPLGETYRAGLLGSSAVERVVSLRLFNGAGIDGERFWEASQGRQELRSILSGGPFGEVVDSSFEGGVCYVAHEFVFGRSLAEMLDQARETACPVPMEHALQIMDRVAIGLHNAHDQRLDGKRVTHGYLVPAFVQLSSEGEIRLTGFESTGAILDLPADGAVRSELAGYTSPEVSQGETPKGADDVYSMGSIFFELLTGERLPPISETGAGPWIDAGVLADEASPLSPEVRQLLHQSLCPRAERIQSAELWHRELLKISSAGGYSPNTFNLAFFMHTLFGEELDREVRVVEAERQERAPAEPAPEEAIDTPANASIETPIEIPKAAPAVEPPPAPAFEPESTVSEAPEAEGVAAAVPSEAELEEELVESVFSEPQLEIDPEPEVEQLAEPELSDASTLASTTQARTQSAADADSRKRMYAGVAVLAVAVGLALAVFVFDLPIPGMTASGSEPMTVAKAPRMVDLVAVESGVPLDPTSEALSEVEPPLSPEELESQVRSLVAERAESMEKGLKAEYDQRLVELRKQLEEARQAAASNPEAKNETGPTPTRPEPALEAPVVRETPARRVGAAFGETSTPQPAATGETEIPSAPVEQAPTQAMPEPKPVQTAPAPAESPAPEPTEPEVTEPEAVEPGSIVEQGPGVSPPSLVRQPNVVYPPAAMRLKREASVRVRILVDEKGRPTEIEQLSPKIGMGFDQAAMRAAKSTRWSAPTKDGVPVKMWVELAVDFRP